MTKDPKTYDWGDYEFNHTCSFITPFTCIIDYDAQLPLENEEDWEAYSNYKRDFFPFDNGDPREWQKFIKLIGGDWFMLEDVKYLDPLPPLDSVDEKREQVAKGGMELKKATVWKVRQKWVSAGVLTLLDEEEYLFWSKDAAKERMIRILVDTGRIKSDGAAGYAYDGKWENSGDGEMCFTEKRINQKASACRGVAGSEPIVRTGT